MAHSGLRLKRIRIRSAGGDNFQTKGGHLSVERLIIIICQRHLEGDWRTVPKGYWRPWREVPDQATEASRLQA